MANDQSTPQQPDKYDQLAAQLMSAMGMGPGQQSQPAAPGQMPESGYAYSQVGGNTVPFSYQNTPISGEDIQRFRTLEPNLTAGPFAETGAGDTQAAREYQSRVESPYMMFGAN
jgi:hypothetical protein